MAIENCAGGINNLNQYRCKTDWGQVVSAWLDRSATGVTVADAPTESTWTTKVNADEDDKMIVMPYPDDVLVNEGDPVFAESNLPDDSFVRNGLLELQLHYKKVDDCLINKFLTLHEQTFFAYLITINNDIVAKGDGGINLLPNKAKVFVYRVKLPEGKDSSWNVIVSLKFQATEDLFTEAVSPTAFQPKEVDGVIDVAITSSNESATAFDLTIVGACDSNREISVDFVVADFEVKSGDADISGASISRVGNVYSFTDVTGAANGDVIGLKLPPNQTTKGYKSTTNATLSIS